MDEKTKQKVAIIGGLMMTGLYFLIYKNIKLMREVSKLREEIDTLKIEPK